MDEQNKTEVAQLTSEIVAAYVANNSLPAADLPALINSIHRTLGSIGQAPALITEAEAPKRVVRERKRLPQLDAAPMQQVETGKDAQ